MFQYQYVFLFFCFCFDFVFEIKTVVINYVYENHKNIISEKKCIMIIRYPLDIFNIRIIIILEK